MTLALAMLTFVVSGCAAFPEGTYWPLLRARAPSDVLPRERLSVRPAERSAVRRADPDRLQAAVSRRWADEGLARSARRMSAWAGRCTYADALGVLGTCYVDPVRYGDLVAAGLESLRAALDNPTFRSHFPEADDDARRGRFADALGILALKARAADPWFAGQAADWLDVALEKNRAMLGLPDGAVVAEMLFGAFDGLDPYTRFITPEMREVERREASYVGIGIEIALRDGRVFIRNVFLGSPAAEAGLAAGDEIVAVDGCTPADGADLDAWMQSLRGRAGSTVRLTVRSPWADPVRQVDLVRRTVDVPPVEGAQLLPGTDAVAYVRLRYFGGGATADLRRAIRDLRRRGAKTLVLDLRDNPGGELLEAVQAAGLFLPGGRVLETRGRMLGATWRYDVPWFESRAWSGPMAVLVDGDTASAAETLAAALVARGRATIVGRRTFGKGAAQIVVPVDWGTSAVCVTIARVYDPLRECIESRGVVPAVTVEAPAVEASALEDDPDVRAAIQHIRDLAE